MPQVNGSKNHVMCFPLHIITPSEAQFNARDEDEDDEEVGSSGNDEINQIKEDAEEIAILPNHSSSTTKLRLVPSFKSLLLHLSHSHHHHHHHASCDGNGMTHHDGLHDSRDSMTHNDEHDRSYHDGHDRSYHGGEHDISHHAHHDEQHNYTNHDEGHARHGMTPQDEHRDGHGMAHHGDHNDANGSTHHHHDHLNLGKLLTRSISLPIWHPTFTMASRHGPTLRTVNKYDHYEHQHAYMSRQSHAKIHYATPPKGHVALYVDDGHQRLVVPISYLNHPDFQVLLRRAQDEFGFRQQGGLVLPCSLSEFQHTLARIQLDHTSHHCHH